MTPCRRVANTPSLANARLGWFCPYDDVCHHTTTPSRSQARAAGVVFFASLRFVFFFLFILLMHFSYLLIAFYHLHFQPDPVASGMRPRQRHHHHCGRASVVVAAAATTPPLSLRPPPWTLLGGQHTRIDGPFFIFIFLACSANASGTCQIFIHGPYDANLVTTTKPKDGGNMSSGSIASRAHRYVPFPCQVFYVFSHLIYRN
jgi:hypothetical protein